MRVKIYGMPLPEAVYDSLAESPCMTLDCGVLSRVFGVSLGMDLQCSYLCLEKETLALKRLQGGEFALSYGLAQGSPRSSGLLDADRCLCLGVNSDEEGICLDYRVDQNSPAILLSTWHDQPDGHARWVLAAETFGSFMLRYASGQSDLGSR